MKSGEHSRSASRVICLLAASACGSSCSAWRFGTFAVLRAPSRTKYKGLGSMRRSGNSPARSPAKNEARRSARPSGGYRFIETSMNCRWYKLRTATPFAPRSTCSELWSATTMLFADDKDTGAASRFAPACSKPHAS
eukprot:3294600-Rhodomonas_salina.1